MKDADMLLLKMRHFERSGDKNCKEICINCNAVAVTTNVNGDLREVIKKMSDAATIMGQ